MNYFSSFKISNSAFPRYKALSRVEEGDEEVNGVGAEKFKEKNAWTTRKIFWRIAVLLLLLVVVAVVPFLREFRDRLANRKSFKSDSTSCPDPPMRREWRQLNVSQKKEYISATKCLQSTASRWHENDTLYDDFPRLYQLVGTFAHEAATFLSWHRCFIQIYETTLREKCGYTGYLTYIASLFHYPDFSLIGVKYWDWSLDYEYPAPSIVFNSSIGFGGNGGIDAPDSVGKGRCVTDGPFAGLQAKYFNDIVHNSHDELVQHCLSRGFKDGNSFSGHKFRPKAMERLFRQKTYDKFFLYLELGPYNGIPQGIQGDFMTFTALYDPLFFLHHTQIDRLWWIWQQEGPSSRLNAYAGRKNGTTSALNKTASLNDLLPYHELGGNIVASEVMSTRSKILCYQY